MLPPAVTPGTWTHTYRLSLCRILPEFFVKCFFEMPFYTTCKKKSVFIVLLHFWHIKVALPNMVPKDVFFQKSDPSSQQWFSKYSLEQGGTTLSEGLEFKLFFYGNTKSCCPFSLLFIHKFTVDFSRSCITWDDAVTLMPLIGSYSLVFSTFLFDF